MIFSDINLGGAEHILYLISIPLFIAFVYFTKKRERSYTEQILPSIAKTKQKKENPYFRLSPIRWILPALILICISILRPQYGFELIEGVHEGVDLIIAADVSESMLAEDAKPDRLNVERRKISDLLNLIQGDRVALISFAGASFIETPLTLDYKSLELISKSLTTDLVPLKGSSFESAALSATKLFVNKNTPETFRARALLMFSDGEFEEGSLEKGLKILKENEIVPFLIVLGQETGAPIPDQGGFRKDIQGKIVISKADVNQLNQQFQAHGGRVIRATLTDHDLKEIYFNKIKKELNQKKLEFNNVRKWNEYYQYFLFFGLFMLLIAWAKPIKRKI